MRKTVFFLSVLLVSVSMVSAQDLFKKGTNLLNAGIGIGSGIPVELSFEHCIKDGLIKGENGAIGIGAYGGWYHESLSYWSYNHYVLGVRGTFHYQFVEKLDTYAGLMGGYNIATAKWTGDGESIGTSSGSAIGYSFFVGARYWFKPNLAVYAEAGYGIAYLSAGVAFKF
ncbi:MAG: hypothetical protein LBT24_05040 [Tannerella sp.]|jgi:hypothetical protein|nr:hypothetical protein [Tannerella sp.]